MDLLALEQKRGVFPPARCTGQASVEKLSGGIYKKMDGKTQKQSRYGKSDWEGRLTGGVGGNLALKIAKSCPSVSNHSNHYNIYLQP